MKLDTVLIAFLVTFWSMTLAYAMAMMARNLSFVRVFWGPTCLVACTAVLWWHRVQSVRGYVAFVMVALWALRLAVHVGLRTVEVREEDWRYTRLRVRWGVWTPLLAYARVFLMQAVEAVVVTLPVVWVLASPSTPMRPIDWVAVLVWVCGFIYECIADTQLTRFLQNRRNKGSVLTRGLWKFSRHPNYAGELVQWWALWLLAVAVPGGWMSVAGPLLLTLGIARSIMLVESTARRRPEYARYTQRVPVLIPQLFR